LLDSLLQERKSVRWLKARPSKGGQEEETAEMEEGGGGFGDNSKSSGKATG